MKNARILTLALILIIAGTFPLARVAATKKSINPPNYAPGEVIVKLKSNAAGLAVPDRAERLMTIARLTGEAARGSIDRPAEPLVNRSSNRGVDQLISRRGLDRVFVLKFDESTDVRSVVADLRARQDVEYAEPNYLVKPASLIPDDPNFSQQWALLNSGIFTGEYLSTPNADIKAYRAWDITLGDPKVIVALTDTGVDQGHPDLAQSLYTNPLEIPGNGIDDDHNGFVDDVHGANMPDANGDISDVSGHGTEMAGVIGAGINNGIGVSGVSQSKILPVKFYTRYGPAPEQFRATVADAAKALLYSVAAGASIINASWRTLLTPEDVPEEAARALFDAVNVANDAGVLFVCTAGNEGYDLDYSNIYPAAYRLPNQIVVAASDPNDDIWHPPGNPFLILTGFGPNSVHLAAPGVSVLTTQAHGDCVLCSQDSDSAKWYTHGDGTSYSAAFVSGVAALVKSRYPDDNALILKQRILKGVEVIDGLRPYVINGGRLNAVGALTSDVRIVPPVLDGLRYKSKKLTATGSGMQPGVFIVVGRTGYPTVAKSDDGTIFMAKVPKSEIPAGTPVSIKLRNPDGGESKVITFTR